MTYLGKGCFEAVFEVGAQHTSELSKLLDACMDDPKSWDTSDRFVLDDTAPEEVRALLDFVDTMSFLTGVDFDFGGGQDATVTVTGWKMPTLVQPR